jgi:hypothetical protein
MPTLESLYTTVAGVPSPYDYITQPVEAITPSGGTATMDNGSYNVFSLVISSNTTIAHSNVPSTGTRHAFELHLAWMGGTITWPSEWTLGDATPTETGEYLISGVTLDGGTNWKIAVMATADIWTPSNITTALWLDAADASTITESSGAVSEWRDKSGNGYHVSQGTSSNQPATGTNTLNGINVLTFDGSNDILVSANNQPLLEYVSVYVVVRSSNVSARQGIVTKKRDSIFGFPQFEFRFGIRETNSGSDGKLDYAIYDTSSVEIITSATSLANNTWAIISGENTSTDTTIKINGSVDTTNTTSLSIDTASKDTANRLFVGGSQSGVRHLSGDIAEVIICLTNQEKIEGYLAHKWGLTANLPSDHPYKNNPPRGL